MRKFMIDSNILPASLLIMATVTNLTEIELAFGARARRHAFERLRNVIHDLFDDEEIHEVEDAGLIEVIVRPRAEQGLRRPGLKIGQLCTLICANPITSEVGAFFAIPGIGTAVLASRDANIERARKRAYEQARFRPNSCHLPEVSQYQDDMAKAVHLMDQVARGGATLVWQPTVGPVAGAPVLYYEGLLRIGDGAGNLRSAEPELLALERMDLAPELDRRLMTAVLDELEANPKLRLGINISSKSASLYRYGACTLWQELRERLDRKPDLARHLVIEITETADFVSLEEAREFIAVIQELGCLVAVDDFGAGWRSIIQLSALAADIVKIDGRFVRDASKSDEGYETFLHLVRLGTSLASAVIVEGVETAHQARLARHAGADWLQGYQFARPSAGPMLPVVHDPQIMASSFVDRHSAAQAHA